VIHLHNVPNLIVTTSASPHLNDIARSSLSVRQVQALIMTSPFDSSTGDSELLILVPSGAVVDLHFVSVSSGARCYVEAFGSAEN